MEEVELMNNHPAHTVIRVQHHPEGYPDIPGTAGWSYCIVGRGERRISHEVMGYTTELEARLAGENEILRIQVGAALLGFPLLSGSAFTDLTSRDSQELAKRGAEFLSGLLRQAEPEVVWPSVRLDGKNMLPAEVFSQPRETWGAGPWTEEPDGARWHDQATGLPCFAVRNYTGAWCGYVGLRENQYLPEDLEDIEYTYKTATHRWPGFSRSHFGDCCPAEPRTTGKYWTLDEVKAICARWAAVVVSTPTQSGV